VEIGAVYNGFCKPQSCQKQKDNYSTAYIGYAEQVQPLQHNIG